MKFEFLSTNVEETYKFASVLADLLFEGSVILMHGQLGSGKTAFAKGIGKGLGIKGFRPDVTGVTKNGLRVVEVVSSSQTYTSQVAKVGRMMGQYSHISNGLTLDALRFITSWFVF